MDLVKLLPNVQDTKLASSICDNICQYIMTISNHTELRMSHYITIDVTKMVFEELYGNTSIDRKKLIVNILDKIYLLNDDEKATVSRDIDILIALDAIQHTPFFKRNFYNLVTFLKKKFL